MSIKEMALGQKKNNTNMNYLQHSGHCKKRMEALIYKMMGEQDTSGFKEGKIDGWGSRILVG